jgi:hypothetical protein
MDTEHGVSWDETRRGEFTSIGLLASAFASMLSLLGAATFDTSLLLATVLLSISMPILCMNVFRMHYKIT